MKVLHLSDLHFHPFASYSRVLPDGRNSRLAATMDAFRRATRIGLDRGARVLVVTGDWWEVGKSYSTALLSPVAQMLTEVAPWFDEVHMIPGNHDMASLDGSLHGLTAFRGYEDVSVHDEPSQEVIGNSTGHATVTFVPFQRDPADLERILAERRPGLDRGRRNILCLHTGIANADRASGAVIDHGAVDPLHFEGWDLVISGHYHRHQSGTHPGGQWIVPGSLVQVDASEEGQEKGFVVVDYETLEWEFVPVKSPQFVTVRMPTEQQRLAEVRDNPMRYVWIQSETPEFTRDDADRLMEGARALYDFRSAPRASALPRSAGVASSSGPAEAVDAFVQHVKPEGLDPDRLAETGRRYL